MRQEVVIACLTLFLIKDGYPHDSVPVLFGNPFHVGYSASRISTPASSQGLKITAKYLARMIMPDLTDLPVGNMRGSNSAGWPEAERSWPLARDQREDQRTYLLHLLRQAHHTVTNTPDQSPVNLRQSTMKTKRRRHRTNRYECNRRTTVRERLRQYLETGWVCGVRTIRPRFGLGGKK